MLPLLLQAKGTALPTPELLYCRLKGDVSESGVRLISTCDVLALLLQAVVAAAVAVAVVVVAVVVAVVVVAVVVAVVGAAMREVMVAAVAAVAVQ